MLLDRPLQQAKRDNHLQWDEYFMALAFLSAMRSKDPVTQVGACIVDSDNKIVSMGYNGMPIGLSDDELPWTKRQEDPLQNKNFYGTIKGCKIYLTLFPCHECAKVMIQSGIREVIYFDEKRAGTPSYDASKIMFLKANVKLTLYSSVEMAIKPAVLYLMRLLNPSYPPGIPKDPINNFHSFPISQA
ncbi:Deoxycytidylate deaminase [Echinococcus granulosus]|uniref:dCMP deaminase n=1 Tax=Echinococcus granulosus TaxID=6210 RepID=W6UNR4_ECHGR|nr:Deoxycytidylate deaminase [Echinococcus granulosus]EUB62888.1 Deoxycytidylate deaminase [Echinococcus granulosus]